MLRIHNSGHGEIPETADWIKMYRGNQYQPNSKGVPTRQDRLPMITVRNVW
jgi:hypothetical protein